jgi:magnesium chelatase family protein
MIDGSTLADGSWVIGELSLDGRLRPVPGALAVATSAIEHGVKRLFLPVENAGEAAVVEGVLIYPTPSLCALIDHLSGRTKIVPAERTDITPKSRDFGDAVDMRHVRGQEQARRVLEIAAAGGHNLLLCGPPGSGKTLLARTIPTILPPLDLAEALEVTKIWSVAGTLPSEIPIVWERPFRTPHHTASAISLVGGGANPRPGEVSLAHRGVLFCDEFPEFGRQVLENLRQPLEDGAITVSRAAGTIRFPARFMLVAAMNPCPCGLATDRSGRCSCAPSLITKYQKRISGPILDRIDMSVDVPKVEASKLVDDADSERSDAVRSRVVAARDKQIARMTERALHMNAEMTAADVRRYVGAEPDAISLLKSAIETLQLSARAMTRTLKVARTIADLEDSANVAAKHVAEALQYRPRIE